MKRFLPFLVCLIVLSLILAGCGGGGAPAGIRFIDCTGREIARTVRVEGEIVIEDLNMVAAGSMSIHRGVRADVTDANGKVIGAAMLTKGVAPDGIDKIDVDSTIPAEVLYITPIAPGRDVINATGNGLESALPVTLYDSYRYGGWYGVIISTGEKVLTQVKAEGHIWLEWGTHVGLSQYYWNAIVPAYIADNGIDSMGANYERIASIKSVDLDQLATAPAETWLEKNKVFVCRVPDGYVKIALTQNEGLIWQFSPTPNFP